MRSVHLRPTAEKVALKCAQALSVDESTAFRNSGYETLDCGFVITLRIVREDLIAFNRRESLTT